MALSHQTESPFQRKKVSQKQTIQTGTMQNFSGNLSQDEWDEEEHHPTGQRHIPGDCRILRATGWFGDPSNLT